MTSAEYQARVNNPAHVFDEPVHPGAAPTFPANPTQHVITQTLATYDRNLRERQIYTRLLNAIKQQIIAAVEPTYLHVLEDELTGYSQVTPLAMIQHLKTEYGKVTTSDLEANRRELSQPWSPDDPIETLWHRIDTIARFATHNGKPIPEDDITELTLEMFEKNKLFLEYCKDWRDIEDENTKTLAKFKRIFGQGYKTHKRAVTAAQAGYNSAHAATASSKSTPSSSTPTATPTCTPCGTSNNIKLYYCWTHGLGKNKDHTSKTCKNKAEGHQDDAHIGNMMGGSTRLIVPRSKKNKTENQDE